ncbi:MAG: hypothetical protein ACRCUY_05240 [Thermoguttaceae bacterium]
MPPLLNADGIREQQNRRLTPAARQIHRQTNAGAYAPARNAGFRLSQIVVA